MTASVGEPLISEYQIHELYSDPPSVPSTCSAQTSMEGQAGTSTEVLVNTALLAHIEVLESENRILKERVKTLETKRRHFQIEDIAHDDKLVRLYTGFISYMVLISFFEFLGPSVN